MKIFGLKGGLTRTCCYDKVNKVVIKAAILIKTRSTCVEVLELQNIRKPSIMLLAVLDGKETAS